MDERMPGRRAMEMNKQVSEQRIRFIVVSVTILVTLIVLVLLGIKFHGENLRLEDALGNTIRKSELLSDIKANLLKSVEAEKSAVLADTDEASKIFADQSLQATAAANEDLHKLHRLVEEGRISEEVKLLGEFDNCWTEFQKIDQVLLELAVQNTNIKATKLSYTEGCGAMTRFEQGLGDLIKASLAVAEERQIVGLAFQAFSAMQKIHCLEAPHILASSDQQMDEIEGEMRSAAEQVRISLKTLDSLVNEKGKAPLMEAEKAYAEFTKVNAEVIELSRQNTNVKSMELSLNKKRKVTVLCEDVLGALQETVRSRTFRATK
jgi:hypothetical protein